VSTTDLAIGITAQSDWHLCLAHVLHLVEDDRLP